MVIYLCLKSDSIKGRVKFFGLNPNSSESLLDIDYWTSNVK